jgi:hypothetical protein
MRKHTAANEALKLTLDEQRGTAFEVALVELAEEGLQVLPHDAVQHPELRGPPYVGSRDIGTCRDSVKLHQA